MKQWKPLVVLELTAVVVVVVFVVVLVFM